MVPAFFKPKSNFFIRKGSPWENECRLMLIGGKYLNMIIDKKSVHEQEDDTSSTVVDNLIDMQIRKIVFGTSFV